MGLGGKVMKGPPAKNPRKNAGTSAYNAPLSDEVRAMIWTLTEEGHSQRMVGEKLKIAPSTVGKELATDPVKLESLRARQRESRARGYTKIEEVGLDEIQAWMDKLRLYRTGKKRLGKHSRDEFLALPKVIQALRAVTETSTKAVQLLTGGVTERYGTPTDDLQSPEQLIEAAIELGRLDLLPPALKKAAEIEIKKRGRK